MPPRRRPTASPAPAADRAEATAREQVAGFLLYLKSECGLSQNTVAAYRTDLLQFLAWFAEHGPAAVHLATLQTLSAWLGSLRERGLAATSAARKLVTIKMFFRYLLLEGHITDSVADLVNSPKLWEHLPKVLSPDRVNQLIDAPDPVDRFPLRDKALLTLLYATGCRISEVCGLTLSEIHLEDGFCRCLGKGSKERIVSLNPVAKKALEDYLAKERPKLVGIRDSASLFLSGRGQPLTRIAAWKIVKRCAARIGASSDVSPHTLRHSFATHMLAGGAEIRALQELLGHASIRTTQVYTHVEHSRLKSIHEQCHPRG